MSYNLVKDVKPDSYDPTVYDVNYDNLYENGIRYAVFDVDCTILPFNDTYVSDDIKDLFKYISDLGIYAGLCSSGFDMRVRPVASSLGVNYIAHSKKPFDDFRPIYKMFDCKCAPAETAFIGDSLFFDMLYAGKNGMYKILVDMIKKNNSFLYWTNELLQARMYSYIEKTGFEFKKYYKGYKER